jgi:16S rRNA processing protein RimM
MSTHEVVVGRIGKPHGIHGELSVEPRTDEPERRFAVGASLGVQTPRGAVPPGSDRPATLTVRSTRWHQSRLLIGFEEVGDRTAAEGLRGLVLVTHVAADEAPEDPEEFYDHQLVGLRVLTTEGQPVGEVAQVIHGAGQDLLAVHAADGREVLVPFVTQLVPEVDVPGGRLTVVDQPGLLAPADDEA